MRSLYKLGLVSIHSYKILSIKCNKSKVKLQKLQQTLVKNYLKYKHSIVQTSS